MMSLVLLLLYLVPSSGTLDIRPPWWSRALASIQSVCVVNNTCHYHSKQRLDDDYNRYASTGLTPCCEGCSCHPSCHLEENCCFPSLQTSIDRSRQKCIYPNTEPEHEVTMKSFNMYVDCDPNIIPANTPDATDQQTFLEMQPLYSKTTGRIYYNKTVALCNGVTDWVDWTFIANCLSPSFSTFDTSDLDSLNRCIFRFEYPGNASDLRSEECFNDPIDTCPPGISFEVPPGLNMSADEIRKACSQSDFMSPFRPEQSSFAPTNVYANVFCYICHNYKFLNNDGMCPVGYSTLSGKTSLGNSFSIILSSLDKLVPDSHPGPEVQKLACSTSNGNSDCRPVSCPSAQQLLPSGNCDFIMETLLMDQVHIYLKLQIVDDPDIEGDLHLDFSLHKLVVAENPWPEDIFKLVRTHHETKDNSSTTNICRIDFIVAVLEGYRIATEPHIFFSDIENRLKSEWLWHADGRTVRYNQTFIRHPEFLYIDSNTAISRKQSDDGDNLVSDNVVYITTNHADRAPGVLRSNPLLMTKMFFCDQVVLKPHEYDLLTLSSMLHYKEANTMLYYGEFVKTDGNVKICLSDSVLQVKTPIYSSEPRSISLDVDWYCRYILFALYLLVSYVFN